MWHSDRAGSAGQTSIQSVMAAYGNQSGPVAVFVCTVCQNFVGLVSVVQDVRHSLAVSLT